MSAYAEPPTAPITSSDIIKTRNGIFESHLEQVVLFALVVTFCSCQHSLHFFFINGSGGGGGYQNYLLYQQLLMHQYDMQVFFLHCNGN